MSTLLGFPFFAGLVLLVLSPLAAAGGSDAVISRGEGLTLTAADYRELLVPVLTPEERDSLLGDDEALRELVLDMHSDRKLADEALAAGLAQDPEVAAKLSRARERILVRALMDQISDAIEYPDFEALAVQRYQAKPEEFRTPERRKAAHILLTPARSCRDAITLDEVLERLNSGEDFGSVAADVSDDGATAAQGGVIDIWATRGRDTFVPEFQSALFKLEAVGDISEPVKTRFGTHLIQLAALEEARIPPFEEIKDRLVQTLRAEYRQGKLGEKRSDAYPDPRTINLDALKALLQESAD